MYNYIYILYIIKERERDKEKDARKLTDNLCAFLMSKRKSNTQRIREL